MCLSRDGFPERGPGGPVAAAIARLTFSMSCASGHYFHNGPSFPRQLPRERGCPATTPEELPSFRERGQAPSSLHRFRRSFRRGLIDRRYRRGLPRSGRSRTFTGQCCRPFCPGDPASHSEGPRIITKRRPARERIRLPRLHQVRENGPPSKPKRDASRTIFTWPLRHRSLPPDAGSYPLSRFE